MEVFSQNYFPAIKETPYPITLGPHAHFWFVLAPQPERRRALAGTRRPDTQRRAESATPCCSGGQRKRIRARNFARLLRTAAGLARRRGAIREHAHGGADRVSIEEAAPHLVRRSDLSRRRPETYALPVQIAHGEAAHAIAQRAPHAVIARFAGDEESDPARCHLGRGVSRAALSPSWNGQSLRGKSGELRGVAGFSALGGEETWFRPRRFSARSRAIPRCSSRTSFS